MKSETAKTLSEINAKYAKEKKKLRTYTEVHREITEVHRVREEEE